MANNAANKIYDVLIVPLPLLLSQTAQSLAEAQIALDEASIRVQQQLDLLTAEAQAASGEELSGLARFQVDATWYHIPEAEIEIKMSLSLQVREEDAGGGRMVFRPRIMSVPHNAKSRNLGNFEAEGTSRLSARIVSVPPSERQGEPLAEQPA